MGADGTLDGKCNPFWHDFCRERLRATVFGEAFPSREQLWWGAVLGTLAQVADGAGAEQSWIGPTYVVDPMSSDLAALTFVESSVVGMFFFHEDRRSPWPGDLKTYDIYPFLQGMPSHLIDIACRFTLPAMAVHDDEDGLPFTPAPGPLNGPFRRWNRSCYPTPTAVFWGDEHGLDAAESWPEVYEHGAHLLDPLLLRPEEGLVRWQQNFGLSDSQADRVMALFRRLRARNGQRLPLSVPEWQTLEHDSRVALEAELRETGYEVSPEIARQQAQDHIAWARGLLAAIGVDLVPGEQLPLFT